MLRIAVTGPESSGKTTLCKSLSEYFGVNYIPEFARAYLEERNGVYNQNDLDLITVGQLDSLNELKGRVNVCDTDFSVIEIWSKYKYGNVSELINQTVNMDLFDLHILCSPDIPWREDPLRENPDDRDELFILYLDSLKKHNKNFIVVSGAHKERLEKSLKSIDILLKV